MSVPVRSGDGSYIRVERGAKGEIEFVLYHAKREVTITWPIHKGGIERLRDALNDLLKPTSLDAFERDPSGKGARP